MGLIITYDKNEFVRRASEKHSNKYDYSLFNMKYLKEYKLFESRKQDLENSLSIEDIQDIFIDLKDNNLYIDDCKIGNAISMNKEIITDIFAVTDDFDIREAHIESVSIKLKTLNNEGILIDSDFFNSLQNSIGHMESQYNLKVNSIFYRTHMVYGSLWAKSVNSLKRYLTTKIGDRDKMNSLKSVLYIDITFEIL